MLPTSTDHLAAHISANQRTLLPADENIYLARTNNRLAELRARDAADFERRYEQQRQDLQALGRRQSCADAS